VNDGVELVVGDLLESISELLQPLANFLIVLLNNLLLVNHNEVVVLLDVTLQVSLLEFLENDDTLLDVVSLLVLINLLLQLGHLVLVEELFHLPSLGPAPLKQIELVDDLPLAAVDLQTELCDHFVLHHIVEEGERNELFVGFIVLDL